MIGGAMIRNLRDPLGKEIRNAENPFCNPWASRQCHVMGKKALLPPPSSQVSESRYCFLSDSIRSGKRLRLLMAGREVCSEDYVMRRAGYPTLALEIVVEGSGTLRLHGKTMPLRPGMLFTYGPGITHTIKAVAGSRLVKSFVDFTGEEGVRLLKESGLLPGKMAMARDPDSMLRLIDLMLLRSGSVTDASHDLCADYLRALLRLCAETVPLNRRSKDPSDCYRRAVTMIDADYAGIRSVSDLARRLDVTPEHLTRTFKIMGDESPLKRITLRRLQHASDLLIAGGSKVKIVAAELGYTNPFHFSAVFKRHFGYPPRALQRRVRGGVQSIGSQKIKNR